MLHRHTEFYVATTVKGSDPLDESSLETCLLKSSAAAVWSWYRRGWRSYWPYGVQSTIIWRPSRLPSNISQFQPVCRRWVKSKASKQTCTFSKSTRGHGGFTKMTPSGQTSKKIQTPKCADRCRVFCLFHLSYHQIPAYMLYGFNTTKG